MINLSICFSYLICVMAIGVYSSKKAKTLNGFFLADRKMGGLFVVGSLGATIIGGSNTIGMAGLGFKQGLVGSLWLLVGSFGLIIISIFLAGKLREFSLYTLPELLEKQYDEKVKLAASILICLAWIGIVAGQMIAAGTLLTVLIPASLPFLIVLFFLVLTSYTILGGQYSIIRTDFVQLLIIVAGIILAALLAWLQVGGLIGLRDQLPGEFFSFPTRVDFSWLDLLSLIILVGSTYLVGPDIYSRLFCAKDAKTAKLSAFSAGIIIIPLAFLITTVGMCARVLFPEIQPEEAFPMIIKEVLPGGVGGLVIASLLAALMSSADTCLLTTSAILTMDIYRPYFGGPLTEKRLLALSRWAVILVGLLSLMIALWIKGVIAALLLGYTVFTSGLAIPIVAGFYQEKLRLNSTGALAAIIGGGGVSLIGKLMGIDHIGLFGFAISGMLLFGISRLRKN